MPMVDPPSRSEKCDRFQLARFRFFQRAPDIFGFPGSRQANEQIAWNTKGGHLASENFIESIIIARGSQQSAIARQTNRRIRSAIFAEATTSSVAKCAASAPLPPLPQTSNLFPARKHCSIRSAAFATCASRLTSDSSVRIELLIAWLKIEEESLIEMQVIGKLVRDRGFEPLTPTVSR